MNDEPIVNVATHLARLAAAESNRLAVACHGSNKSARLTFRELHERSVRLAYALQSIGIKRGLRTVLMVPPSLDFFALTFALFKIGSVPVLIDPGMGLRNLGTCLAEAEPEAFVGTTKANLARKLFGWARQTIRITATTGWLFAQFRLGKLLRSTSENTDFSQAPTTVDETAAILFTSGSTGVAKGAVYTHGNFAAQVELLRQTYGIEPGEADLCTFPLFALFGPALGMTAIIPQMNPTRPAQVDPRKIIAAIEEYKATNLFGSPALIDRVGRYGTEHGTRLPTLRRVISAGAPVPAKVVERFSAMLGDGAQVFTPYGATEALPVASIDSDELRHTRAATECGCGVCVGRPVDGMEVRIVGIDDGPIREWNETLKVEQGQIGEIVVSGPVVTTSYFNRPEATELAKIDDPDRGRIWHRMGDLGYLDSLGRLWFCGRKSQRVVTKNGTLFTISCEAVFNSHPGVFRTALVGVPVNGDMRPVVCIEREPPVFPPNERVRIPTCEDLRGELDEIAARHRHTRALTVFLCHRGFPVDIRHNAKIFREKLATWAARKLRHYLWPDSPGRVKPPPTFDDLREPARSERP
jgi:acyl-CoA synthetase (AMP-forming)/AMP-acid ligase II